MWQAWRCCKAAIQCKFAQTEAKHSIIHSSHILCYWTCCLQKVSRLQHAHNASTNIELWEKDRPVCSPAADNARAGSGQGLLPFSAWLPCAVGKLGLCSLLLMVTVSPSRKRLRGLLLMTVKPSSSSNKSELSPMRSNASRN